LGSTLPHFFAGAKKTKILQWRQWAFVALFLQFSETVNEEWGNCWHICCTGGYYLIFTRGKNCNFGQNFPHGSQMMAYYSTSGRNMGN